MVVVESRARPPSLLICRPVSLQPLLRMICDLNVRWPSSPNNIQVAIDLSRRIAADLATLGYHVIAFNQVIEGKLTSNTKSLISIPQTATDIPSLTDVRDTLNARGRGHLEIKQLSRVTLVIDEMSQISNLSNHTVLKQFDLVAVQPSNEKVWIACCQTVDCDIISLDMSQKLGFYFKHTMVNEAIRRGICFEITYASAFKDSTTKRNLISNATNLLRVTKGKNIILSSGARLLLDPRGPLDVINFGCLLGLNADKAKHTITSNCRTVLLRAETRRNTYRAAASCEPKSAFTDPVTSWKFGIGGDADFVDLGSDPEEEDNSDAGL